MYSSCNSKYAKVSSYVCTAEYLNFCSTGKTNSNKPSEFNRESMSSFLIIVQEGIITLVNCPLLFSSLNELVIFFMQPGPRDSLVQCYIKRNRSNQTYYLFLGLNQGKHYQGFKLNQCGKLVIILSKPCVTWVRLVVLLFILQSLNQCDIRRRSSFSFPPCPLIS